MWQLGPSLLLVGENKLRKEECRGRAGLGRSVTMRVRAGDVPHTVVPPLPYLCALNERRQIHQQQ